MECDRDRYGSVFYRADQCGFKQEACRVICRLLDVYEVKWSKVLSASRMFWGLLCMAGRGYMDEKVLKIPSPEALGQYFKL